MKSGLGLTAVLCLAGSLLFGAQAVYADDEFVPAYQNEGQYELEDPDKYFTVKNGRRYYTSGKEDGFRVNENNEESTDETVGILTFLIAPATNRS